MLHVIRLVNENDNETYGDLYLINLQRTGIDKPIVFAYSPKRDCYLSRDWNSVRFVYFLDEKGHKYDKYLKRIRKEPNDNDGK